MVNVNRPKLFIHFSAALFFLQMTRNAHASFVFNVQQQGLSVIVTGNGTLNLSALAFVRNVDGDGAVIGPSLALLAAGPVSISDNLPSSVYTGISGPARFGSVAYDFSASTGFGDTVGVGLGSELNVPVGYVSGAPLSDSATFSNYSFTSLGLIPGTYLYEWGSGPSADSLTINIGVVPEPASAALIAAPVAIAALRRRRRVVG